MTSETISKDMTIEEIFAKFPQKSQKISQELMNAGLHCVGCHAASFETLEAGIYGHGFSEDDLNKLLDKLNFVVLENSDPKTIVITKRAAIKFLKIVKEEKKENYGLRFDEIAGGCGGFEFSLDFAEKPTDEDETFESNGVKIFVRKDTVSRLLGSEIDYTDGLKGAGFKISNPHVKTSCSCGTSHSY